MAAQACNSSTWEVEAGSQPWLMYEDAVSTPQNKTKQDKLPQPESKLDFNPSAQEAEAGRLSEFKASLIYIAVLRQLGPHRATLSPKQ